MDQVCRKRWLCESQMQRSLRPQHNRVFWQRFMLLFTGLGTVLGALIYFYTYQRFDLHQQQLQHGELVRLERSATALQRDLQETLTDLNQLSHSQLLLDYLRSPDEGHRLRLQQEFVNLAVFSGLYDQVRLLGPQGQELVRVNYQAGKPLVVEQAALQDKSSRYYFQQAAQLPAQHSYLSPLDLNVENGAIEQPLKPVLRAAKPLYVGERLQGVLVLNYLATPMLARLESIMRGSWGEGMLVNADGYWLYHPDAERRWGFMLGHDARFDRAYPLAWDSIEQQQAGLVNTAEGLFFFVTLSSDDIMGHSLLKQHGAVRDWKLISRVDPALLTYSPATSLRQSPEIYAGLLLIAALLSYFLAWLRSANFDQTDALKRQQEDIRALVQHAPDGIFVADLEGRYIDVNEAGCLLLGWNREQIIGKTIIDLIPAEDIPRLELARGRLLRGEVDVDEWRLRHRDGHYIAVEVSAKILADGRWQGFVRDVSERKQAEEKLRQAAAVFDNTSEAIMVTDALGTIVAVNEAYSQITGYSADEVLGKQPSLHQSGHHDQSFYQQLWQALKTAGHWQGEIWNRRKNGEVYPAWETISAVRDGNGDIVNYVSVLSDISSIKEAENRLRHLAHHDSLTDLPNRVAFLANLEQALEHAQRNQKKVALLFLDLDRFKLVNDTLGHDIGDELLKSVAQRLKRTVRGEDLVARLGGDEFTVMIEGLAHAQDAALLARKVIDTIVEPIKLQQHDISTSTSIGIGIYPDDAHSVSGLLKAADAAMYRAKHNGRGNYEFYTSELTQQAVRRLSLENDLRQAIQQQEFELFYQPQVALSSGSIVGLEALLRWRHPELGLMQPDQFIHIAEDSGLIDTIGGWVVREAFAQACQWREQGLPAIRMAVNISGHQILYDGILAEVKEVLDVHDGRRQLACELEITESTLQTGSVAVQTLTRLRELGISIAIDDFGTGYSSLSQLQQLPIDTLKIDRAFLQQMPEHADSRAIASAIISLGHSLGLRVVAEGVENIAQLKFLKEQGCDEVQGFLVSEPVAADAAARLLQQGWQLPSGLSALQ